MAAKPEIISFGDFVNNHREDFTPFELWIVDELTEYLVNKLDLDKEYTSVVLDADEDNPVGKITDNKVSVRLNGRFYLPKENRQGNEIVETTSEWAKIAKEWFDSVEIEVTFDDEAEDLLKFTAMVPAIDLEGIDMVDEGEEVAPENEEIAPEGDEGEEGSESPPEEETPPEGEETAPTEEGEETPPEEETKEEETPEEESSPETTEEEPSEELKDFEKALGL